MHHAGAGRAKRAKHEERVMRTEQESEAAGVMERIASVVCWAGVGLVVAAAAARCAAVFLPMVVFDVDPAGPGGARVSGLGPAGSMILDSVLICGSGLALAGWAGRGGRMMWWLVILGLAPAAAVVRHGVRNLSDLWTGLTWMGAAAGCVACAHAAQDRRMRAVVLAGLVAAIGPVLGRGISQVTQEHALTVESYEQNKEAILASRGWSEDSPDARMFERRLKQVEPLGWFTTTNIFASLMLVGVAAGIGLGVAARRAGMESGWWTSMYLVAGLCAGGVVMSGSKGGVLATAGAVGVLWLCARLRKGGGWIALGCVGAVVAAVVVRGVLLPEGFADEKSVLFRWHYLQGARAMAGEEWAWGVGPGHFQRGYMAYRPARSPEEVASAHNVFADWIACLGVSGWAWVVMTGALLWRAGKAMTQEDGGGVSAGAGRGGMLWVMAVGCASLVLVFANEWRGGLDDGETGLAVRVLCVLGFTGVMMIAWGIARSASVRMVSWAAGGAAVGLLMHSQIEMTLTQPGSAAWGMCLLGVAGGAGWRGTAASGARRERVRGISQAAGVMAGLAMGYASVLVMAWGAWPAAGMERRMRSAAEGISEVLGDGARDERGVVRSHSAAEAVKARTEAAEKLERAFDWTPWDSRLLDAAAGQMLRAAGSVSGEEHVRLLRAGMRIAERAINRFGERGSLRIGVEAGSAVGAAAGDAEAWEQAEQWARRLTEMDPRAIGSWRLLGDVLWARGKKAEASEAYSRALENDRNFELDDLKQLRVKEREELERRAKETE